MTGKLRILGSLNQKINLGIPWIISIDVKLSEDKI